MNIKIGIDKGKLRLIFSRSLSREIFGVNRKAFSLGLDDTPENKDVAQQIILEIQNDIRANRMSTDLNYYLPVNRLRREVGTVYDPDAIKISCLEMYKLWYKKVKKPQLRPNANTRLRYETTYVNTLKKCPQDLNNIQAIVDAITEDLGDDSCKRLCSALDQAFNWIRLNKSYDSIPNQKIAQFVELYKFKNIKHSKRKPSAVVYTVKPDYVHNYQVKAFTEEEMYKIIQRFRYRAFEQSYRSDGQVLGSDHIASRIKLYYYFLFKFMTGVRPGEACGLLFSSIGKDNQYININKTWNTETGVLQDCLKTEKVGQEGTHARKLICDENLGLLLEELQRRYYKGNREDFVFAYNERKPFDTSQVSRHWSGTSRYTKDENGNKIPITIGAVTELIVAGEVEYYLPPYNTRHTWINLQIKAGTNPLHICYMAGNTKEVMEMYYMSKPRPEEIDLKASVKFISSRKF